MSSTMVVGYAALALVAWTAVGAGLFWAILHFYVLEWHMPRAARVINDLLDFTPFYIIGMLMLIVVLLPLVVLSEIFERFSINRRTAPTTASAASN